MAEPIASSSRSRTYCSVSEPLQQAGPRLGRLRVPVLEGKREELGCLRVRSGACGRDAGLRRVPQDPHRVARAACVVYQHGGILGRTAFQRVEHPPVQSRLASRRERAGDRQPAQVVAEGDAALAAPDQPGAVQGAEWRDPDAELREQPVGNRLRRAHQEVEQVARGVLEVDRPGQDGVADRARKVVAVVVEHLVDEERVAAGERVQAVGASIGVDRVVDQRADRCAAQRSEVERDGVP